MRPEEKGKVYLVGSGPGDPELLTMRAVRLLETADVVFHDDVVSDEVLGLVQQCALVTSVGTLTSHPSRALRSHPAQLQTKSPPRATPQSLPRRAQIPADPHFSAEPPTAQHAPLLSSAH